MDWRNGISIENIRPYLDFYCKTGVVLDQNRVSIHRWNKEWTWIAAGFSCPTWQIR